MLRIDVRFLKISNIQLPVAKKTIAVWLFSAIVAKSAILTSADIHAQDESAPPDASAENIAGSTVFDVAKDKPYSFFTLTFQNDVFVNEDDGYTNGLGLTPEDISVRELQVDDLPYVGLLAMQTTTFRQ